MKIKSRQQIIKRRKEIEQELVDMLKETGSDFSLQDVKDAIFHEEDNDDMMKVVAMFDPSSRTRGVHYGAGRGGDVSELDNILELVSDAWNYFPHKVLNDLSPAEKMLKYEEEKDNIIKQAMSIKNKKLNSKQKDLLWSGGGSGPYSQVNLIKQVRVLDDSVSRIFIVVEAEINPTTFEIVKANRDSGEFKDDPMIQQLLDRADYRGPQFGYVVAASEFEYTNDEVMIAAESALGYTQKCIIKMHRYVMDNYKV